MTKRYFVTGTDTEIGKTTVSAGLLAAVTRRGLRAAGLKPAESGCESGADGLVPADAVKLREAAGGWQSLNDVCGYRFAAAVAPGVAANREGQHIDLERIITAADRVCADFVLMEGAGGWLVPLGQDRLIADLAVRYGAPVLIVARCGLGTINHTLLTIESVRARGLEVAGVVLCDSQGDAVPSATASNQEEIARVSGAPMLGVFDHVSGPDFEGLAAAAERLDLARLL